MIVRLANANANPNTNAGALGGCAAGVSRAI